MASLEGKRVVVVGGTSGIGYSVAKSSLISNAELVVVASSSPNKVQNAVSRLEKEKSERGLKGKVLGKVVDASSPQSVKDFAKEFDEIDHLVWTSGGIPNGVGTSDIVGVDIKNQDLEKFKGSLFSFVFNIRIMVLNDIDYRDIRHPTLGCGLCYPNYEDP